MSAPSSIWLLMAMSLGCGIGSTPDPRSIEGAMGYAALAVERNDPAMLYRILDERARHALISIVQDRTAAAALVRETYPPEERDAALRNLGDAAEVEDAAGLFARRCDPACRQEIGRQVGAPASTREDGDETVVETARGTSVRIYRAAEGSWWGLVWETQALDRERNIANQALRQVERNAETYRRRQALEAP